MPQLASTSRAQISFLVEATFGTTPVTGTPAELRMTGESLTYNIGTDESKEIRDDRMKSDLVQVSAAAGGGINIEMSFREYDPLLEALLQGSWLGANDIAITATITLANTLTASAGTPFANIAVGQVVRFTGWATPGNNLPLTVVTQSATVLTFAAAALTNEAAVAVTFSSYGKVVGSMTTSLGTTLTAAAGTPFVNVVAGQWMRISNFLTGAAVTAQVTSKTSSLILVFPASTFNVNETSATCTAVSSRLSNGTTQRSFSIEKNFADITQYFIYKGMNVSKMTLGFKSGSMITGAFDFMGKSGTRAATTGMPNTPLASQSYEVMNAVSGVASFYEGGALLTGTYVKSLDLAYDNKLRGQDAVANLGPVGMGNGTIELGGTMEVYLADGTLYDKFVANTASSMSLRVQDSAYNGYVLQIPRIKYKDAKVVAGSRDQDAMISLPFESMYDPTTGKQCIIDRVGV